MINKIFDFFKKYKYPIIWTVCYAFIVWAILFFLFKFDIFVRQNWIILSHAHLRGFPGFVFGILILSAIPIYIATTAVIVRTKQPLFTIKLPKFLTPIPDDTQSLEETNEKSEKEITEDKPQEPQQQPEKIIPTELQFAFARARTHIGPAPKTNFDISNITSSQFSASKETTPELQSETSFPLPNDFDIEKEEIQAPSFSPVFSDINFDEASEADTPSLITNEVETEVTENQVVTEYLIKKAIKFTVEKDLIFTEHDVIASHTDPDFWIADNETWFAAGRHKASPIDELLVESKKRGLRPVLYLGSTNILDIESRCNQWSESGITVIKDLEILNIN